MNCRSLVVIAVVFGGLVPAAQLASAELPTRRIATATATILSPLSTHGLIRHLDPIRSRDRNLRRDILIKFIDHDGFVTAAASPDHRKIIIIDMP